MQIILFLTGAEIHISDRHWHGAHLSTVNHLTSFIVRHWAILRMCTSIQ
jgi:hypothetical protein